MDQVAKDVLLQVVMRLPDWIRHDLMVKDTNIRMRAEEALAAMLAGALEKIMTTRN